MPVNALHRLKALGQSIWINDFRCAWLTDGTLARLIADDGVTGVTSNPAIFAKAIAEHDDHPGALATLGESGITAASIYEKLVVEDMRGVCDMLRGVHQQTRGADGYASLDVARDLEVEGVRKFVEPHEELMKTLELRVA